MQQPNNKAIDAALDLLEKGHPLSNLFQEKRVITINKSDATVS